MATNSPGTSKLENYGVVVPPDGGWGWVVVITAFYCNMVIDGILSTFGIFLQNFMDEYQQDEATITLIGSLMYGSHLISEFTKNHCLKGPICNALITAFGVRAMSIAGSIVASLSLCTPVVTDSLILVYVFYAVLAGMAMCFVHVGSMTSVMVYFSKYRIRAVGIVVCGSGLGQVVVSIISNELLRVISWKYVLLTRALLVFSMTFVSFSYTPLRPARVEVRNEMPQLLLRESTESIGSLSDYEDAEVILFEREKQDSVVSAMDRTQLVLQQFVREYHGPHHIHEGCAQWCRRKCSRRQKKRVFFMHPETRKMTIQRKKKTAVAVESTRGTQSDHYEPIRVVRKWDARPFWGKLGQSFKVLVDFQIFHNLLFIFFCLSSALSSSAITIVYGFELGFLSVLSFGDYSFVCRTARIKEIGVSDLIATALLASLGAASLFWRILLTLVSSFPHCNYHALYISTLIMGGVAVIVSSMNNSLYFQFFNTVVCGLGIASFALFRPVLLLELVGLQNVSNALGICLMFMGIFASAGPPIAGLLAKWKGSYDPAFWMAGAMLLTASLILIIITGTGKRRVHFDTY